MNKLKHTLLFLLIGTIQSLSAQPINADIDYEKSLSNHDMIWNIVPDKWQLSPFSGNGNVGFLFYQTEGEAKNTMSLHVGRHDVIMMLFSLKPMRKTGKKSKLPGILMTPFPPFGKPCKQADYQFGKILNML